MRDSLGASPQYRYSDDTPEKRLSKQKEYIDTVWQLQAVRADHSVVKTDVTVTSSDKVLTLSTCTPGGASRFIVMGKLTKVHTETE